jgi:hypothetical protein
LASSSKLFPSSPGASEMSNSLAIDQMAIRICTYASCFPAHA